TAFVPIQFLTGTGPFNTPKTADVPGISDFQGPQWHAMNWPSSSSPDSDLTNKRVGIIGTGPSAIQIVGEISKPEVGIKELKVYQRSPGHCLPRDDRPFREITKWVFRRFPWVLEAY